MNQNMLLLKKIASGKYTIIEVQESTHYRLITLKKNAEA